MLVEGLPIEAATWREERPVWSTTDDLIAGLIQLTDTWGRRSLAAKGVPKSKLPKPIQIEHPDRNRAATERQKRERKLTTDPNEIAAFFAARR